MRWIQKFESTFNISQSVYTGNYLIIEGEKPYIQTLGKRNQSLAFNLKQREKNYLNKKLSLNVYANFDNIAFLVRGWIKIQDSLEMIFNLLTGSSSRSLEVLSYLRKNRIPTCCFAAYLFNKHKLILVNRSSGYPAINSLISSLPSNVNVLMIGKRKFGDYQNNSKVQHLGFVLHPSGRNLNSNSNSQQYYDTWYELNAQNVTSKQPRRNPTPFPLNSFCCLK
jgi:hypothetical protein